MLGSLVLVGQSAGVCALATETAVRLQRSAAVTRPFLIGLIAYSLVFSCLRTCNSDAIQPYKKTLVLLDKAKTGRRGHKAPIQASRPFHRSYTGGDLCA